MPNKRLAVILRGNDRKDTVTAKPAAAAGALPVVALINQGTEGASEILAGGLRDSAAVKLIGAYSWGNPLERTAFRLADGSGYTLTTGKYLTPAGTDYLNKGLEAGRRGADEPGRCRISFRRPAGTGASGDKAAGINAAEDLLEKGPDRTGLV